jgi:3-oxoacyl-[acyl-carrier-protein] synthase-3
MERRTYLAGTGSYAPDTLLMSSAIEDGLGLERGWIERRTGVRARHVAGATEAVSDLAVRAAELALREAGEDPADVSLLVLATSTPDHLLPPTAPSVAYRLGVNAPAFDLAASCSGFLYGMAVADRWLRAAPDAGSASVLLIGANVLTRRVRWTDPKTAPLFGDGAGAVLLRAGSPLAGGLRAIDVQADGSRGDQIHIPGGGSRRPLSAEAVDRGEHLMVMTDGSALFRHAVRAMVGSAQRALRSAGVAAAEIDWFVPHQASSRIIQRTAELLGIPGDRVLSTLESHGNTSAASIPMALHEASADARFEEGSLILLAAAGAGLTSGAAVIEWGR